MKVVNSSRDECGKGAPKADDDDLCTETTRHSSRPPESGTSIDLLMTWWHKHSSQAVVSCGLARTTMVMCNPTS